MTTLTSSSRRFSIYHAHKKARIKNAGKGLCGATHDSRKPEFVINRSKYAGPVSRTRPGRQAARRAVRSQVHRFASDTNRPVTRVLLAGRELRFQSPT